MTKTIVTFLALLPLLLSSLTTDADPIEVTTSEFDLATNILTIDATLDGFINTGLVGDYFVQGFMVSNLFSEAGGAAPCGFLPAAGTSAFDLDVSSCALISDGGVLTTVIGGFLEQDLSATGIQIEMTGFTFSDLTAGNFESVFIFANVATGEFELAQTDIVFVNAVPEPSTILLLGLGMIGMGLARRKKV